MYSRVLLVVAAVGLFAGGEAFAGLGPGGLGPNGLDAFAFVPGKPCCMPEGATSFVGTCP